MRDLLIVATFEHKEDDDFTEGSAVVLNGHMIYYWDRGQDGGNHTETIVNRLTKALDPVVKKISTPIKCWWDDQEIEACVRGLTMVEPGYYPGKPTKKGENPG